MIRHLYDENVDLVPFSKLDGCAVIACSICEELSSDAVVYLTSFEYRFDGFVDISIVEEFASLSEWASIGAPFKPELYSVIE